MTTATPTNFDRSKLFFGDGEIIAKAIVQFNRDRKSQGLPPCQPSTHLSEVVENVVTLRNTKGDLAMYKVTRALRLRRI